MPTKSKQSQINHVVFNIVSLKDTETGRNVGAKSISSQKYLSHTSQAQNNYTLKSLEPNKEPSHNKQPILDPISTNETSQLSSYKKMQLPAKTLTLRLPELTLMFNKNSSDHNNDHNDLSSRTYGVQVQSNSHVQSLGRLNTEADLCKSFERGKLTRRNEYHNKQTISIESYIKQELQHKKANNSAVLKEEKFAYTQRLPVLHSGLSENYYNQYIKNR